MVSNQAPADCLPGPALHRLYDVKDHRPVDSLGVVEREPVGHPPAAVVTKDRELIKPETLHQRHHVGCHGPLGIRRMVRGARRSPARSVATEICVHHGELLSELRSHAAPRHVRFRKPVQHPQGQSHPTPPRPDGRGTYINVSGLEALKHGH